MLAWPQVHGKGAGNGNGRRGRWVQRRHNDAGHDRRDERGRDEGGGERNGVHVGGSVQCAACSVHLTLTLTFNRAASLSPSPLPRPAPPPSPAATTPTPLPPPPPSRPPAPPPSLCHHPRQPFCRVPPPVGCTGKSAAAARGGPKMRAAGRGGRGGCNVRWPPPVVCARA